MNENQNKFANGHDRGDIEPDLISEEKPQQPVQAYFNLEEIATEEDDLSIAGENVLNHIEVRKPHQQEFFRVHPTWQLSTRAIIDKRGGRDVVHLLHKSLMPWSVTLEEDSVPILIVVCINLKGQIFLWVVRKGKDGSDPSSLYSTALQHIEAARSHWIRRLWVGESRMHVKRVADLPNKPAWPENITFQEIVVAGFKSRIIRDENAPLLKELRGEGSNV
jgi:hypothetical protein